eukprot:COSAG04_NODE_21449_length_373_cov_1.437956_1_plen_104_part_01
MVRIELPKVEAAGEVQLDVQPESLQMGVPGKYSLAVPLPYRVNEREGSAKFDAGARQMEIRLPVVAGAPKRTAPSESSTPASRAQAAEMIKQRDMDDKSLYRDY